MPFVETDRLLLRKTAPQDYPYFRDYLMDKEMDRMMLRSPCRTEEDARLGFDWFLNKEKRAYGIVYKSTGNVIGNLTVYDDVPESIADLEVLRGQAGKSLSFALAASWRRRGLMSEAVRAVIEHLFREEGADYIHCGYLSYNTPSKALQEKLGFTPLLTERFQFEGEAMESVENILRRADWEAKIGLTAKRVEEERKI